MKVSNEIENQLSEREQLLLSRFCDGECGCVQNFFAKRLLAKKPQANEFVREMRAVRACCSNHLSKASECCTTSSLWEKISIRIEQETRAELYLGRRRLVQPRASLWERLQSPYTLAGGLSGAVLAGTLLFLVYQPTSVVSFSIPQIAQQNQPDLVRPVALDANAQLGVRPQVPSQAALEVDWLRSHGSLRVIPDSNGHTAIIWVHRRPGVPQRPTIRSVKQRAVIPAVSPIATLPTTPGAPTGDRVDGITIASER